MPTPRNYNPRLPSGESVNIVRGPTILLIWERFLQDGHSDADLVSTCDLCTRWSEAVSSCRLHGGIYADRHAIGTCVAHIAPYICQENANTATMNRWLHALLCCSAGGQARIFVQRLQGSLNEFLRRPQAHQNLRKALDKSQSIRTLLEKCCRMILKGTMVPNDIEVLPNDIEAAERTIEILTSESLEAFGFRGDEPITYRQLLALCFGRFEVPVSLHMYDLSSGSMRTWTSIEGVWHTSVVVFGVEYFYNGRPVMDTPGKSDFGDVTKVLHLGTTFYKQDELHAFVSESLASRYNIGSYDVIEHNCNHFSDEVLVFLLDERLPDDIMNQKDVLFQIPGMRLLWPALRGMVTSCNSNSQRRASLVCQGSASVGIKSSLEAHGVAIMGSTPTDTSTRRVLAL